MYISSKVCNIEWTFDSHETLAKALKISRNIVNQI